MNIEKELLTEDFLEYINNNIIEDKVEIYTDGSCLINDSKHKSTHAIVIIDGDNIIEHSGSFEIGTNNKSELMALLWAIQIMLYLKEYDIEAIIYSDSKYAINTLFVWSGKWLLKKKKKKNMEFVIVFHNQLSEALFFQDHIRWIKGHSGNRGNDLVDKLCLKEYNK